MLRSNGKVLCTGSEQVNENYRAKWITVICLAVNQCICVCVTSKYEQNQNSKMWSVKPVFGEVHPRVLHEFTYVTVNVSPFSLLRHNSSYVAQCVVVEWISNNIVNITSMRNSCNYNQRCLKSLKIKANDKPSRPRPEGWGWGQAKDQHTKTFLCVVQVALFSCKLYIPYCYQFTKTPQRELALWFHEMIWLFGQNARADQSCFDGHQRLSDSVILPNNEQCCVVSFSLGSSLKSSWFVGKDAVKMLVPWLQNTLHS